MHIARNAVLALGIVAATLSAEAAVRDDVHRTFNVADGGTLTLDADLRDVTITTGGSGVAVDIFREARSAEVLKEHDLTFDQQGNDVHVRSKHRGDGFHWFQITDSIKLRYEIRVPSRYNLNLATSGGDLKIAD